MRKCIFFSWILLAITSSANAQLVINGGTLTLGDGATITVQGDLTSNMDILGTGKIIMGGTSLQQVNMNGLTIPNLEINSTGNVALAGNAKVSTSLLFTTGKILTGNNTLTLNSAATLTGATASNFVVTNGTGKLTKDQLGATPFTFPVGATTSSYTPVTIANTGTADNISVRSGDNVLANGLTGAVIAKEVVDATWEISEAVAGGSSLNITTSWTTGDELPGFDRTKAGIGFYDGIGWDLTNANAGAASGSNPYTYTRNAVVPGAFAVGRRPVMLKLLTSPKVFLQGPYNAGTHLMGDNLRAAGLIPPATPYDALGNFAVAGSGGAETVDAAVLAVTGNDAIVDWVFGQLHDGSTGAVITTRSLLVQADGDVVETDGVTPANFAGFIGGNYYVSIRHRNHLGVRTAGTTALARTTPASKYDFTTSQSQAYAGSAPNPAMASLEASVFGMYGGDANSDATAKKTGSATTNDYSLLINAIGTTTGLLNVYRREDFNMDGSVKKTGSATSNDYSKLLSILGTSTSITQPTF